MGLVGVLVPGSRFRIPITGFLVYFTSMFIGVEMAQNFQLVIKWSAREWGDRAERFGRGLRELGVEPKGYYI